MRQPNADSSAFGNADWRRRAARQVLRPVHGAPPRHTRYPTCGTALRRPPRTSMCSVEYPRAASALRQPHGPCHRNVAIPRATPFTSEAPTCALMASTGIVDCTEGDTGSGFASYNIATDTWSSLASIPGGNHYGSASGCVQWQGVCSGRHDRLRQRGTGVRCSEQYVVGRDGSAKRLPVGRLPAGRSVPVCGGRLRGKWAC